MLVRKTVRLVPFTLLFALLGSTCVSNNQSQPKLRTVAALRAFSSPDELRKYLADQAQTQVGSSRSGGGLFSQLFSIPISSSPPLAAENSLAGGVVSDTAGNASVSSDPFSTTNIQEEGVDESDIVKNDGQTIYALDSNQIHVTKATPAAGVSEVATIKLDFPGDALYLKGTSLVAISRQYGYYYYDYGVGGGPVALKSEGTSSSSAGQGSSGSADLAVAPGEPTPDDSGSSNVVILPPFGNRPQTIVTVYDVSDPAHPALKATVTLEGNLADSRLIDSKLHLIIATAPILPNNPTPLALHNQDLATWIPDYLITGPDGGTLSSGDIVGWENVFRPDDPDGYGIVTVVTMDVDQPTTPFTSTSITADAGVIYASKGALYISDTDYSYTENFSRVDTAIHKLVFTDTGTTYAASGIVPGRPLNQYSLGEFKDKLRVATHIDASYAIAFDTLVPPTATGVASSTAQSVKEQSPEGNAVYVLSENIDQATLDIVGKVEDIAPGEQIYAARFVGDRGFLVTFHRVDPLFTLDLSDPTQPFIAGQLKVPGYSDHIQLLDENHLLTIGKAVQDAGSFAWMQGVQISIFDVTDLANPALVDKAVIGGRGTSSEANYNPKAFNYFAAKNALAFPIDDYSGETVGPEVGTHTFTGLYVFHVTAAGFQFLGRISSDAGLDNQGCFYGYYGFTRGVFIGNDVYSVTQRGVKVADLDDVSSLLGQTTFAAAPQLYPDCYLYAPTIAIPEGDGLKRVEQYGVFDWVAPPEGWRTRRSNG